MGETHSSFGHNTIDGRLFLVTLPYRCKKEFCSQTEPPEKEFVFAQKSTIGLVLQDNITIIFVWTWLFWGGCPNADLVHLLEVLNCRAARIIYNLPRDVPTDEVYRNLNWNTLILI